MALENGLIRCNFLSKLNSGQAVSNTFYIHDDGAGAPPDFDELSTIASDLSTWFAATYKALLQEDDTFVQISAYQVTDPAAPVVEEVAVVHLNVAGTNGSGPRGTPDSVAGILSLKTPNASKRYRGHMFLPGSPDPSDLNGDIWVPSTGYSDLANALAAKFAAGIITDITWEGDHLGNYNLVVFSKAAAMAAAPAVANVSAVIFDTKVHWLRSRERGSS